MAAVFPPIRKVGALLAMAIFIAPGLVRAQTPPKPPERNFNLLVLGDSILWGQGLKDDHKAWYQVQSWLQETNKLKVEQQVKAHSGAVINASADAALVRLMDKQNGELNRGLPSINDQLDLAAQSYSDPSQVDLVLVDGCINDIGITSLLNAGQTVDDVRRLTAEKCGEPVEQLLARITSSFPKAHVVVTGYFPLVSEKTPHSSLMKSVTKFFYQPSQNAGKISAKELHANLIALSAAWYEASNLALAEAVRHANDKLIARGSRQRVMFAEIPFPPEYAFSAKQTRLWGFNASFFRKLLALITLDPGKIRTNDERRSERVKLCDTVFAARAKAAGSGDDKFNRLKCHYASIGHPNRKGANLYAESIIRQLKSLIAETGWLKENGVISTSPQLAH